MRHGAGEYARLIQWGWSVIMTHHSLRMIRNNLGLESVLHVGLGRLRQASKRVGRPVLNCKIAWGPFLNEGNKPEI